MPIQSKFSAIKKFQDSKIGAPKDAPYYQAMGWDRIEELMKLANTKTKFMPRTILLKDLDKSIYNMCNDVELNPKFSLVSYIDGKKVPVFYLENDRWGEFSTTWTLVDNDNNVLLPYSTLRRIAKEPGTRLGTKWRIPQARNFRYIDIPILDEGQILYLRMKCVEPVNVDLLYTLSFFTKFREDVNAFDEQMLKVFASHQSYVFVKGFPLPVLLESQDEANTMENIEGDRFYMANYKLRLLGLIWDEKEFQITKTSRKPIITLETR